MDVPRQVIVYIDSTVQYELLQEFLRNTRLSYSYNSPTQYKNNKRGYKPSKEIKDFWGGEFLTQDGILTSTCAKNRLILYGTQHGLLLPNGITLDANLQHIFRTDVSKILWFELDGYLAMM